MAATKAAARARAAKEAAAATKKASAGGSRKGSKNLERPVVEVVVSHCKTCGSTDKRTTGQAPLIQDHSGIHHGKKYTHIVRRRYCCKNCGQHRIDLTRENRL